MKFFRARPALENLIEIKHLHAAGARGAELESFALLLSPAFENDSQIAQSSAKVQKRSAKAIAPRADYSAVPMRCQVFFADLVKII